MAPPTLALAHARTHDDPDYHELSDDGSDDLYELSDDNPDDVSASIVNALEWTVKNASAELANGARNILHDRSLRVRMQKAIISLPLADPPGHLPPLCRRKDVALSSLPAGYPPGHPDFESDLDDDSARSRANTIEGSVMAGSEKPLLIIDHGSDKSASADADLMLPTFENLGFEPPDLDEESERSRANTRERSRASVIDECCTRGATAPHLPILKGSKIARAELTGSTNVTSAESSAVYQLINHFEEIGTLDTAFNRRLMHALMVAGLRS